jgi:hypothetical protein
MDPKDLKVKKDKPGSLELVVIEVILVHQDQLGRQDQLDQQVPEEKLVKVEIPEIKGNKVQLDLQDKPVLLALLEPKVIKERRAAVGQLGKLVQLDPLGQVAPQAQQGLQDHQDNEGKQEVLDQQD